MNDGVLKVPGSTGDFNMDTSLIRSKVRDVKDFPCQGVVFKDLTPLMADPSAFSASIRALADFHRDSKPDFIVAIEARGFIFGSALANSLGCGFVPIRKKGKLPHKTFEVSYSCEYSSQTLEIHQDAILPGSKVVVFDDVLATGGTVAASVELVRKLGGNIISCDFLIELDFLNGRSKINDCTVNTILHY